MSGNDNNKGNIAPPIDAFAVVVAANVPPRFIAQMKAGKLKPSALLFEQVGDFGLTAGDPITAAGVVR